MSAASIFDQPAWAKAAAISKTSAKLPTIISTCFNQDASAFLAGTDDGFIMYALETAVAEPLGSFHPASHHRPRSAQSDSEGSSLLTARQEVTSRTSNAIKELCRRKFYGGVGRAAMCERSNLLLLAGATPETSLTVTLWDDSLYDHRAATTHATACAAATASGKPNTAPNPPHILAQLTCDVPIRALKITQYCIIIVDTISVTLFDRNLETRKNFPTVYTKGSHMQNNSNTVDCSLVPFRTRTALADTNSLDIVCLGRNTGELRLIEYVVAATTQSRSVNVASNKLYQATETMLSAHNSSVHTVAVAARARVAVSVSEGGTAIKVIDLEKKCILRQLSRGATNNVVPTLSLSADGVLCVCVSESGTLHCYWTGDAPVPMAQGRMGGGSSVPPSVKARSVSGSSLSKGTSGMDDGSWEDAAAGGFASTTGGSSATAANGSAGGAGQSSGWGLFGTSSSRFMPKTWQNGVNYWSSYDAFCTASLLDASADVEAYSHHYDYDTHDLSMPLTAANCCSAIQPAATHGHYSIFVVIGGLSSESKARCLHVDLDFIAKAAKRMATFILPRDPL